MKTYDVFHSIFKQKERRKGKRIDTQIDKKDSKTKRENEYTYQKKVEKNVE